MTIAEIQTPLTSHPEAIRNTVNTIVGTVADLGGKAKAYAYEQIIMHAPTVIKATQLYGAALPALTSGIALAHTGIKYSWGLGKHDQQRAVDGFLDDGSHDGDRVKTGSLYGGPEKLGNKYMSTGRLPPNGYEPNTWVEVNNQLYWVDGNGILSFN